MFSYMSEFKLAIWPGRVSIIYICCALSALTHDMWAEPPFLLASLGGLPCKRRAARLALTVLSNGVIVWRLLFVAFWMFFAAYLTSAALALSTRMPMHTEPATLTPSPVDAN